MRKFFASLVACVGTVAQANTITTDFTDLWWIPAESGWGANIIQQEDILFATLFVYGQNNAPTWYVASAAQYQGQQNGQFTFTGTLYQTSGPYFGAGSFNAGSVTNRPVGSFTFRTAAATTATITYTVDGVSVTKNVERQTWRFQNFAGSYRGAMIGTYAGCSSGNGPYESPATFAITQNQTAITIQETGTGYTCTYTGTYTPAGNAGSASGTGSCSDGFSQNWSASEMKVGLDFFAAAWTGRIGTACVLNGRMGGVRRN